MIKLVVITNVTDRVDKLVVNTLTAVDVFNPLVPPPGNTPSPAQFVTRLPPPPAADIGEYRQTLCSCLLRLFAG